MLTVAKVTSSAAGGYATYLEGRSRGREAGDYYLSVEGERVEAPGRWALSERGAGVLGVDRSRPVAADAFRAVMSVRHPETGGMLRRVGGNGEAVAAIDATFSAPKSVSVVWALASPELRAQIEAVQEAAVDRALAYAVERVEMTRRRVDKSTVVRERAAEVLASSWRHTTARAVGGRAPDPQLHSHTLIHGAIRASDGELVAVDSRAWFVHQRELDAAYLSELAQGLERLGFAVERETGRRARYFELVGVPEGLRERFSGRHAQVQAAIQERLSAKTAELEKTVAAGGTDAAVAAEQLEVLERSGRLLPGEERSVAMQSRALKSAGLVTAGDLDWSWWQDAQPYGFDGRSVEQLRGAPQLEPLSDAQLDRRVLERLTEFEAVFTDRDVRAAALIAGVGLDAGEALGSVARLAQRGELVRLADGRLTTREHRRMEARVVARARTLAGGDARPVEMALAETEIAALEARLAQVGGELASEQADAIGVACSDRPLVVIVGQAGTGKSTALQAIARAHQAAGQQIIVTSTGALAAERLTAEFLEAGVRAEGFSTAALQAQIQGGRIQLGRGVTVIHDEAALASTREQDQLLAAVEASGGRLIMVGDPRQSRSVGAGGLWARIEHAAQAQEAFVELERIVRARDPADRRDQSLWRSGQHERALSGYAQRGRLVLDATQRAAEDQALEAAQTDRQHGRSTLVIAQTSNEHLDALNARAQALRAQAGELGEHKLPLVGRPYGLRAGDEVQVRHPLTHPDLGRINNGTTARVLDVDPGGQTAILQLSDGRQARFDRGLLDAGQTRLAYVQHPFPAQGATADTAHVICGEHATQEGTYVALTRARQHTRLYAGQDRLNLDAGIGGEGVLAGLAEHLGRSEPEVPSIALPLAHEQHVVDEHARESTLTARDDLDVVQDEQPGPGPEPEVAPEPAPAAAPKPVSVESDEFVQRRARRDQLQAVMDTYPAETARQIETLQAQAGQAQQSAAGAEQRAVGWQHAYQQLGMLGRHGREGREAREHAQQLADQAARARAQVEQLHTRAQTLTTGPGGPQEWERAHPDIRQELHAAEQQLADAVQQRAGQREHGQRPPGGGMELGEEIRWLKAERDRLTAELGSYPAAQARTAEQLTRAAAQDAQDAQAAAQRAELAQQELAELGPLARRGAAGGRLREQAAYSEQQAEHFRAQEHAQRQQARAEWERPGGPGEWERAHPGVRERRAVYEHAYRQAELQHTAELIAHATHPRQAAPDLFVRALGPRPERAERRETWLDAAHAIAEYRTTYRITDQDPGILGKEPDRAHPGGFHQHHAWAQTIRQVREARHQLGLAAGRGLGLEPAQQIRDRGPAHGPGFEI